MPATTRYRENTNTYISRDLYDSKLYNERRQYVNTSTAYDFPTTYPTRTMPKRTVVPDRQQKTEVKARPKTNLKLGKILFLGIILMALCFTVIYRYSVILESNQEIDALEKQYEGILSDNQVMQAKIDRYFEMGEVEKIAGKELGMMKPEANQIFYIDMKMEDSGFATGKTADDTAKGITGTPGALINAFKIYRSYSR